MLRAPERCEVFARGVRFPGGLCHSGRRVVPHSGEKTGGKGYVTLCSNSGEANFEEYREAWHLLREAAGLHEETGAPQAEESADEAEEVLMGSAVRRVQNTFDFVRRQLGKGGRS